MPVIVIVIVIHCTAPVSTLFVDIVSAQQHVLGLGQRCTVEAKELNDMKVRASALTGAYPFRAVRKDE